MPVSNIRATDLEYSAQRDVQCDAKDLAHAASTLTVSDVAEATVLSDLQNAVEHPDQMPLRQAINKIKKALSRGLVDCMDIKKAMEHKIPTEIVNAMILSGAGRIGPFYYPETGLSRLLYTAIQHGYPIS